MECCLSCCFNLFVFASHSVYLPTVSVQDGQFVTGHTVTYCNYGDDILIWGRFGYINTELGVTHMPDSATTCWSSASLHSF